MSDNSRNQKIIDLLNRRQTNMTVFMDEVHKPHNLAAIVRTCDAVGIGEVHAVYPEGMISSCGHTASGSNRWVETHTHNSLDEGIIPLKEQGMQVLAAHFSDRAVDFRAIDYTKPTVVLVGSELYGVTERAAEVADEHVLIPMLGMVQSLNVSVATAIILYEMQRQRETAGMYDSRQIDEQTFNRLRFEWLHPQISEFCQKHQIRAPYIDEQGDIQDDEWHQLRKSVNS
ncbi:tRNA (guanosine(18)-2'-O)-methyltransferase TrmH [Aliikangiella marina]|uniref:tRNA (guanosine(18)-2'-O)-methyltransferase n=1 Tax=Aliikangiella marina TaxID=1712262 RepID=A0A545T944_9GAMM|nr:tRNA (guanosine(18)-2'-O)-methyltransferase TrmH [Aliikangiella marina]TQV73746.1 tRNA (guanosine(18)-2'-O)-methyltransferase TrmH [Aliikangiella marina]